MHVSTLEARGIRAALAGLTGGLTRDLCKSSVFSLRQGFSKYPRLICCPSWTWTCDFSTLTFQIAVIISLNLQPCFYLHVNECQICPSCLDLFPYNLRWLLFASLKPPVLFWWPRVNFFPVCYSHLNVTLATNYVSQTSTGQCPPSILISLVLLADSKT